MKTPRTLADRQTKPLVRLGLGMLTWFIVVVFFFPVLWMVLTGFKTEPTANTPTPKFVFSPTFSEYTSVWQGTAGTAGLRGFLEHSVGISLLSTVIVLCLALPAAYALAIRPVRKWRDVLFFFISTKMLPIVGAIIPLYVIAKNLHLLDKLPVLIILYTSLNLPIAVWMLRSFLLEVPAEIIEAAQVDGAGLPRQLRSIIMPIISPGLAATVPIFLVGFVAPEGQFWAHLSAAATVACLPVLLAGWAAQDKLVRGLSMGAVK